MRNKYFRWNETSTEMLRKYVEEGLPWGVVSGRMSHAFDREITISSCRARYERSTRSKTSQTQPKQKTGILQIFLSPPVVIRDQIASEERATYGFSRMYRAPYPPTEEGKEAALVEHWKSFVDFQSEIHPLTSEEIQAAKDYDPPKWFRGWAVALSIWSPLYNEE